ncbi:AraC family transcriptional regulator [Roseomonas sp. E05]|uniref:helix-turn-helix domain-containing protein n=1 Tax=Roseomonas sp. E05 TaxID=3046310 RepID=UPI0024B98497|nr:AraC family transcriptional regulator [Roseomonas sp. E05]MDJ0388737.1 AraC family transcriptional regulator [Roseomonas sp. E05]
MDSDLAMDTPIPGKRCGSGSTTALVTQLLQQACISLDQDQEAALRYLSRASRLLEKPRRPEGGGPAVVQGGLARWQINRLTRLIESRLEFPILQQDLAAEVRLSTGHFARAFKQSFGRTAHAYVVSRRIERAKVLMLETPASLCEVALACGLADQAHFSRLFRRLVGTTPLAWRRENQPAPRR